MMWRLTTKKTLERVSLHMRNQTFDNFHTELILSESEVVTVEEVNANDVKTTVYEVKVENGLLQINKCVGDNKTAILSEEISENVFPSEDIDELKKGVEFDNLDEAQQMFENFVS